MRNVMRTERRLPMALSDADGDSRRQHSNRRSNGLTLRWLNPPRLILKLSLSRPPTAALSLRRSTDETPKVSSRNNTPLRETDFAHSSRASSTQQSRISNCVMRTPSGGRHKPKFSIEHTANTVHLIVSIASRSVRGDLPCVPAATAEICVESGQPCGW